MTVPFTFVNGTTADATQVNANFSAVLALTGGTVTGAMIFNGAATFNAVVTVNANVTINAILTLGGTLSVPSITYPGTEGHNIAFGWDGTAIVAHVDGTGNPGRLAAWNSGPTFTGVTMSQLQVNGNVGITGTTNCSTINTGGGGITTSGLQVNGAINATSSITTNSGLTTPSLQVNGNANVTGTITGGTYAGGSFNGSNVNVSGGVTTPSLQVNGTATVTGSAVAGIFRLNGGAGARIEDWGGDWGFTTFATSGGNLLFSPDNGATGFLVIPSGSFSDATLKTNIANSTIDALGALMAMPVRSFDWTAEGLKRLPANVSSPGSSTDAHVPIGLVAQEVQGSAPEAVRSVPLDDNLLTIDPAKLVPYLIRAIQQLTERVAALEAKA